MKSKIYAILENGSNRAYVGKTSQPLRIRFREHVSCSLRRNRTTKERWIATAIRRDRLLEIELLDICDASEASSQERRLHQMFTRLGYDLKNSALCGSGGHRPGKLAGKLDIQALGVVTDTALAAKLGVNRKAIQYHRQKAGIAKSNNYYRKAPPTNKGVRRVDLAAVIDRLGQASDAELASIASVSKRTIARERKARGIPSRAESAGITGKFAVGQPHPRWSKQ